MTKKSWLVVGIGSFVYIALTALVLLYYKDDPAKMAWHDREAFNEKVIQKIDVKLPLRRKELISTLGDPDITEAVRDKDTVYQVLYYRTHRVLSDGITTKEECTALLFKNDVLVAIGEHATSQFDALN